MKKKYKKKRSIHPYFTSQTHEIVRHFIQKYSNKYDIVLDPYSGSGVTVVESRLLKRNSIAVDLSKLACEITRLSSLKISNFKILEKDFLKIEKKIQKRIKNISNNNKIRIKYFKNLKLPKNADVKTTRELFTKKNFHDLNFLINEINLIKNPTSKIFFRGVFSGIIHRSSKTFFYDKNKWGGGNSSIFTKYRYWVPNKPDERDVWNLFKIRFYRMKSIIENINSKFTNKYIPKIYNCSSTNLKIIKNNSIDFIYTDPPYGANISYLDLATLWYSWLYKVGNIEKLKAKEVIEGGDIQNSKLDYLRLLKKSFKEIYRVLKYEKYFCLAFSHKDISLWYEICNFLQKIGFEYKKTDYFTSFYKSYHKVNNTISVLTGQMVITFKKENIAKKRNFKSSSENLESIIRKKIQKILKNKKMSTEQIINKIIPLLLEKGANIKNTKIINIINILKKGFKYNKKNEVWY